MKLLALAMFLAVIEAAPPIPRQAADNPAQTTTNVKSKSAPDQAEPLPSLASVKRDSSGPTKADSGEQRPEDAQHTIGISKLPPVTITKDWADWGVWVFSGLLVAVGFLQVWLLYGTLKAIQRQAGIMQDNINLIINKERMRISAQVLPLNLPPAKEGAEYEDCAITCVVRFEGPTRAVIVESRAQGKITDSAEPPYKDLSIAWLLPERVVEPFTGPEKLRFPLYGLSRLQVEMIQNRKSFVHFFGFIRYTDFFDKERETTFCFTWIPRPLGLAIGLERWERSGPPEANRET